MSYIQNVLFKLAIFLAVAFAALPQPKADEAPGGDLYGKIQVGWTVINDHTLYFFGAIAYDNFDRAFLPAVQALKAGDGEVTVILGPSPGGSPNAAYAIGRYIRDHGFSTRVTSHCYSACTLIAIAGEHRYIEEGVGEIGWHSPQLVSVKTPVESDVAAYGMISDDGLDRVEAISLGYNRAVEFLRDQLHYLVDMLGHRAGVGYFVVGLETPAESMATLSKESLITMGFRFVE